MSTAAVPPGRLGFAAGFALLVATGYVDAYTFLRHGHVFAEAVTGNFIFVGIGAFDPAIIAFWRPLLSILAFLLGVFVLSQAVRSERVVNAAPQIGALVIDIVVLAAAGALPRTFPQPVITSLIAFAAGAQNAAFRRIGSATVSTVVMTMNSTQIVGALLDALESRDRDALRRFQALFVALVGFLGGVLLGAWLSTVLHDRAAWVDAGLFLVAGWLYLEHDRRHRAGLPAAA